MIGNLIEFSDSDDESIVGDPQTAHEQQQRFASCNRSNNYNNYNNFNNGRATDATLANAFEIGIKSPIFTPFRPFSSCAMAAKADSPLHALSIIHAANGEQRANVTNNIWSSDYSTGSEPTTPKSIVSTTTTIATVAQIVKANVAKPQTTLDRVNNDAPSANVKSKTEPPNEQRGLVHRDYDSCEPKSRLSSRLHVSNIPFKYRREHLANMFSIFGQVLDAEIIYNERGSKGFGFVSFATATEAFRAKRALHGLMIDGRQVEVNYATPRPKRTQVSNANKRPISASSSNSSSTGVVAQKPYHTKHQQRAFLTKPITSNDQIYLPIQQTKSYCKWLVTD